MTANIIQPVYYAVGDCFYLNVPLTGSQREAQEWIDTTLFVESVVDQIFEDDSLTILDLHDQIQSNTALDADDYINEVLSNLEDLERETQCLILTQ